jgi:aspartyl-tRNA(Asn)/glutamyl-tRNA(Gln) amidotransferase subunit C
MSLSLDQVRKVARLARLELSEPDLVRMQQQLSAILDYVDQLNQLDTNGVEPLAHPLPVQNVFREDEEVPSLPVEAALQNAPNKVVAETPDRDEQGKPVRLHYFGVPAVFDTDEPVSH